jgi:hypothetical protein
MTFSALVNGIIRQLRVSHVPLLAMHEHAAGERAAPADLDGIAQGLDAGRFADEAVIDLDPVFAKPLHDLDRAMERGTFLVGGDEQADGTLVPGVFGQKILDRGDKRRQRGFHVSRAAPVKITVADLGLEGVALPGLAWTGRHDVGMAGEHHQRLGGTASRPQVVHVAEAQPFGLEAERREARDHEFLAAFVSRRLRRPLDQLFGKLQRFIRHSL